MRKSIIKFITLLLLILVLFPGCLVTSLHPLGGEEDIVFDENLIGTWIDDDGDGWAFSKGEKNTYKLIIFDKENEVEFNAKLVKLGDKLFLDICPERLDTKSIYDILMLPTHTFMKFSLEDSELSLGLNEPKWFNDRIEQNKDIGIQYTISDDDIVILTAPTEELRAFYLKHADENDFFDFDKEKLHKSENTFMIKEIKIH